MLTQLFLRMTRVSVFRRLIWKPVYEFLPVVLPQSEWKFMNYGYDKVDQEPALELSTDDEYERFPLQLYHFLASRVEIEGKTLLEVGSGRGGGAFYIARYLKPKNLTGLDLSKRAISFAQKNMIAPGLQFMQGNAENLPFDENSFDVVINVESSHAYGSFDKFVSEVYRVLKPGGYFLITDLRTKEDMERMVMSLKNSGMQIIEETDITERVVIALDKDNSTKSKRIAQLVPKWLTPMFAEFAGVKDSAIHKNFSNRSRLYYRWVLQK